MNDNAAQSPTAGDVRPQSQGDFYPAIIAQIESTEGPVRRYFEVTMHGTSKYYADEAEAYATARRIAAQGRW